MFTLDFSAWKPFWTLLATIAVVPILFASWKNLALLTSASTTKKAVIILRLSAMLVLIFISLQPALIIGRTPIKGGEVLVLVDGSSSVLREGYFGHWEEMLLSNLKEIEKKHPDYRVRVSFFSADTIVDSFAGYPASIASKGGGTTSLDTVPFEDNTCGIILLTDGIIHGKIGKNFSEGIPLFRGDAIALPPIYPYTGIAKNHGYDIAVKNVRADDFAFVKSKFEIKVGIAANIPEDITVPVKINSGGELLAVKNVRLKKGNGSVEVSIHITPDHAGLRVCAVSIPVLEFESRKNNNSASFAFKSLRDRIRVLHVAGRPSWDLRFLRSALKQDPGVDLVSFYIMRTASDIVNVPNEELSLIEFPYNDLFSKDLNSFEVVIFQNFSSRQFFADNYLSNIVSFVNNGGSFIMLGGDLSFTEGGYHSSPIVSILPFQLSRSPVNSLTARFSLRTTASGAIHPVTEALGDISGIVVEGLNTVGAAHDNSLILLETNEGHPYLSIREVGKGRCAAVAGDGIWGLNFAGVDLGFGNRAYLEMIRRLIRWSVKDPTVSELDFENVPNRLRHGELWSVRLRNKNRRKGGAVVRLISGENRTLFEKKILPFSDTSALVEMPQLLPGSYLLTTQSGSGARSDRFVEVLPSQEFTSNGNEISLLREMARVSGGKTLDQNYKWADEVEPKCVRRNSFKAEKVVKLWNHPAVALLFVLFLGAEWFIRRRRGLP